MTTQDPSHKTPLVKGELYTKEEMLEVMKQNRKLSIGIPKESLKHEYRVPLTPEAVKNLVAEGYEVFIEQGAGINSNYSDLEYSEGGASICNTRQSVFNSDVILTIAPLTIEEIALLKGNQIIISYLLLNEVGEEYFRGLMEKKVTAIAFEKIKDQFGEYPVIESMSAISGTVSITIAGEYLSNTTGGKGVMLGGIAGITPTDIVVIGAGTAAEYAIRAALGTGASIKVFDNSVHKLRELERRVGQQLYTSTFHPKVIMKALASADVVIGAYYVEEVDMPYVITEDMVKRMKPGSVIIDIFPDHGSCIETTECRTIDNPSFTEHNIIHYCVPNLPSRVARTSSIALSNVLSPIIRKISEYGGLKHQLIINFGLRNGVYIYNGILTNDYIGRFFDLPSKDIDLLMAAF